MNKPLALLLADNAGDLVLDAIATGLEPAEAKQEVLGALADALEYDRPPESDWLSEMKVQAAHYLVTTGHADIARTWAKGRSKSGQTAPGQDDGRTQPGARGGGEGAE